MKHAYQVLEYSEGQLRWGGVHGSEFHAIEQARSVAARILGVDIRDVKTSRAMSDELGSILIDASVEALFGYGDEYVVVVKIF